MRASRPRSRSLRHQWCAPLHACHGDQATVGQLGTPLHEFIAFQGAIGDHLAGRIHRMNLDEILGQINANSFDGTYGTSAFTVVCV